MSKSECMHVYFAIVLFFYDKYSRNVGQSKLENMVVKWINNIRNFMTIIKKKPQPFHAQNKVAILFSSTSL